MKNGKFYYTDNTATLIEELRTQKKALEQVAGRVTPTSALLGKAISHIALLDAAVYHKDEEIKALPKYEPVPASQIFFRRIR